MPTENTELTQLTELCELLSRGPVAATDLAARLGQVESEGRTAVYVKPSSPLWKSVIISHDRGAAPATYVELALARPAGLTVGQLRAGFGPATQPVALHWDSPTKLHFNVDRDPGRPLRCRVVAQVGGVGGGEVQDHAVVETVAVQPEPR